MKLTARQQEAQEVLAGVKPCTRCGVVRPFCDYSPDPKSATGTQSYCKPCNAARRAEWRLANPEKIKAQNAKAYAAGSWSRFYAGNKERESERKRLAYAQDPQKLRERIKAYHAENPHVRTAITAKRRAKLLRATPSWADSKLIRDFYQLASIYSRELGERFEVDHILPLQGETVSGLHCEANLQILPRGQNRSKAARVQAD